MSDLAEIRQMVSEIQKSTAATAEAMSWVKTGMASVSIKLEAHMADDSARIGKLENRQYWWSGASATAGAIFATAIEYFFRHQS